MFVIYSTYEHLSVCLIPYKYVGLYCEEGKNMITGPLVLYTG